MTATESQPRFLFTPRQRTLLVCGLVLVGMTTVWLVNHFTTRYQLEQQTDSLGATLANQTALLATELVLSNDLISLNVLLTELTRSPAVSQAAVFTVDDQVLAISGPSASRAPNREPGRTGSYVAPIALQDSVAGYVRVYLDQQQMIGGTPSTLWMTPGAMALMLILSATLMTALQRPRQPPRPDDEAQEPGDTAASVMPANAVLHLQTCAGKAGSEAARRELEQSLARAADLYQGRLTTMAEAGEDSGHVVQLQFSQTGHASELAYHALCCAVLVLAMNNRANRYRAEDERITLQAALHCALSESDTTELGGLEDIIRLAELISGQSPENGLLASDAVLTLAGADNHFHSEWHSRFIDLLDGEPHELYLVRAPAGPTRAMLQRQASLLREEVDNGD
ncbi:MAG: AhpA/YtjB family protein [Pseudohongiellaceae bacterium]